MIVTRKLKSAPSRNQNKKKVTVTQVTNRTKSVSTARKGGGRSQSQSSNLTESYFNSLVNPFEYQGCKLGWGCMSPSQCITSYIRGSATANSDGSLTIAALPAVTSQGFVFNSGTATAGASVLTATDSAAVGANFSAARVISIGVKAFPSIAATSAPGIVYTGAIEGIDATTLNAMSCNDFFAHPNGRQDIASLGASASGRPQDTNSFAFNQGAVNSTGLVGTTSTIPFTVPFVAFSGLPASAPVAYEIVCNFEALLLTKHSSAAMGGQGWGDTLANYWSSFEQMWGKFQHYLPSPGQAFNVVWNVANLALQSKYGVNIGGNSLGAIANGHAPLPLPYTRRF